MFLLICSNPMKYFIYGKLNYRNPDDKTKYKMAKRYKK